MGTPTALVPTHFLQGADSPSQGQPEHLANHQQRHQKRVSAEPARVVRPPQPLALLTALASQLADQTSMYEGDSAPPEHAVAGERLWNSAGIGQVFFNEKGLPLEIYQHNADDSPRTRMVAPAQAD